LALCAEWRPDLIVREDMELAGAVVAERLGLPHAAVQVIMRGRPPARLAPLLEGLQELRRALGLPPDPDGAALHRHLLLWPCPASLRHPAALVPPTVRAVRPVPFDRSGDELLPTWVDALPPREERPRVYATLGTASLTRASQVYKTILAAVHDAPVSLVLTLGRDGNPAEYGPQPPHVRIEPYVPQTLLLPHCDAVLFHGGSGTLVAALDHGLPMVVIPFSADQPQNAEAVVGAGAGVALERETLTPDALCSAVLEVLREPRYQVRAETLRQEMHALPDPEEAAGWLEQLRRDGQVM
ncbi:MAG TPA: nucleotide disphospho-sugar-binding domain-containing protein, partial [Chloroflexota bacterium]|nr:nucleotide disphospho-sugar-binding domain-containing protein [Chloroflexota bacterium]